MAQTELLVSSFNITLHAGLTRNPRPKEFAKATYDDEENEGSIVGRMPPSDSEGED